MAETEKPESRAEALGELIERLKEEMAFLHELNSFSFEDDERLGERIARLERLKKEAEARGEAE